MLLFFHSLKYLLSTNCMPDTPQTKIPQSLRSWLQALSRHLGNAERIPWLLEIRPSGSLLPLGQSLLCLFGPASLIHSSQSPLDSFQGVSPRNQGLRLTPASRPLHLGSHLPDCPCSGF